MFFPLILLTTGIAVGAEIIDFRLAEHDSFTLLVITADRDLEYRVTENSGRITVAFPQGTGLRLNPGKIGETAGGFFVKSEFDQSTARLILETDNNYHLTVYDNHRPFQLVMDFAHRPGKIALFNGNDSTASNNTVESPPMEPPLILSDTANDTLDYYEIGLKYKEQGNYDEALEAFMKTLESRGILAEYQIGLVYEELNQRVDAIEHLENVVSDSPEWVEPKVTLALLYQIIGDYVKAENLWLKVINVSNVDTGSVFSNEQISLLELLIQGQIGDNALKKAPISMESFPKIPWFIWVVFFGILLAVIVRLIVRWRMNRVIAQSLGEDLSIGDDMLEGKAALKAGKPEEKPSPKTRKAETSLLESLIENDGKSTVVESSEEKEKEIEVSTMIEEKDEINDEKQQQIYDLANNDYTSAEIARMLGLGQEEVKFILDFRDKIEEESIAGKISGSGRDR